MKLLREYVRALLLTEITELPKEWFTTIDDAIMSSRFWELPNEEGDDPDADGPEKTPAAAALENAISQAFEGLGIDMDVIVDSFATDNPDYMLHPGHPAYPNRWLADARWYVSKRRPGRNTLDMMLMLSEEDVNPADVDPAAAARHIGQTVRHELVHYTQMKKQSASKGLDDDMAAFLEMLEDPSQIPNEDNPKYWEVYEPTGELDESGEEIIHKEGFKDEVYKGDYLRSHIEIDAHAHDAAEELLAAYGKAEALELMRGEINLQDPQLPNAIQHYFEILPKGDPTLTKFRKKLYSYIMHLSK